MATTPDLNRPPHLDMFLRAVPHTASVEELADLRVLAELRFGHLPAELRAAVARRRGELERAARLT